MPAPPPRPPTSKLTPVSLNPTVAQVKAPAVTTGEGENRNEISTYLTKAGGTFILYNADRMWAKITLTLRTAGPVAVGQNANLTPVLSGRGQLLQTGVPAMFTVAKGHRLYIAATAVNPVSMLVEAFPWLETITGLTGAASGIVPAARAAMLATGKTGH